MNIHKLNSTDKKNQKEHERSNIQHVPEHVKYSINKSDTVIFGCCVGSCVGLFDTKKVGDKDGKAEGGTETLES